MKATYVLKNPHISLSHKIYFFLRELTLPSSIFDVTLPKQGCILDLGCGTGPVSLYLALSSSKRSVIGWDIDIKRIKTAKKIAQNFPNLNFELKNAGGRINIKDIKGVVASDFLHHLNFNQQEKTIRNISEALSRNGVFVIKEVDKSQKIRSLCSLFWDRFFYPTDTSYFRTKNDWLKLLKKYKFNVTVQNKLPWFPGSTTLFICKK